MSYSSVILIGGTDPSGGAGIPADLSILQDLSVKSHAVVSAVTAQNEKRFFSYESVSRKNFTDQLRAIETKAKKSILKIGMLAKGELVEILAKWIQKAHPALTILDPVLYSSTGYRLLDNTGLQKLTEKLLFQVNVLTPNLPELEILTQRKISNAAQALNAGRALFKKCPKLSALLIKGGHASGPATDYLLEKKAADLFEIHVFSAPRILKGYFHGTGCALASAIAGNLALGLKLPEAVREAKKRVRQKIKRI